MTPSTVLSRAAKSIWNSGGRRNVIVWAGIQKNGMVFLRTKPHIEFQSIAVIIAVTSGILNSPALLPVSAAMCGP